MATPEQLVEEYLTLGKRISKATEQFENLLKPLKTRQQECQLALMEFLTQTGQSSGKTPKGTFYKSTIVTPKIMDREKYLEDVLANYNTWGAGMLQIGAPKKEAVDEYLREHNGKLPDGITTTSFTRVNIRGS